MRKRTKDFEGCFECRKRKVKCDKAQPGCKRCLRVGKTCPGYSFALVWVTPNHENSKAQGRGGPNACATWRGWPTFTIEELECLLVQLDEAWTSLTGERHLFDQVFSVFQVQPTLPTSICRCSTEITLPINLSYDASDWSHTSRYLLHHYVDHVSHQMMPFQGLYNPWTSEYPRLALENECIRDALLSQAAAHLYHVGCDGANMKIHSLAHRGAALTHLQSILQDDAEGLFEVKIAAILSLIMVDIYFGLSEGWRSHVFGNGYLLDKLSCSELACLTCRGRPLTPACLILGAMQIAVSDAPRSPWSVTDMGWLTAQSLSLLCLRAKIDGSLKAARDVGLELPWSLLAPVSRHPDYGFTVGASQELAATLVECATIVTEVNAHTVTSSLRSRIVFLRHRLISMTLSNFLLYSTAKSADGTSHVQKLHVHIFALGLLIRLMRSTLNPIPSELRGYTMSLFKGVAAFRVIANSASKEQPGFCSPTIWPVFHAAVELYRPEDQAYAREVWLNDIDRTAIGNRKDVQKVLERVWLTREWRADALTKSMSSQSTCPIPEELSAAQVVVEWNEIVEDMGLDLLLV